jgi:Fe2+ transport system protein FeoA
MRTILKILFRIQTDTHCLEDATFKLPPYLIGYLRVVFILRNKYALKSRTILNQEDFMEALDPKRDSFQREATELRLDQVQIRQEVELVMVDLPEDQAEPLFERGFLPGCRICPVRSSPAGDPIVEVDGSLMALRRETANCLCVRTLSDL